MAAQIIDGKQVAQDIRAELKEEAAKLREKGVVPGLGVILVGDDPASKSYVTAKERACEEIGLYSDDNRLPSDTSREELVALIKRMNEDPKIHGILLQLPLPKHLDEKEMLMLIDPEKDVDGFHPMNVGKMVVGEKAFLPCTPHGVVQLLVRSGVKTEGAHVVVVGRSNIVGKPVANMLLQKKENANATVTICHTRTKDIAHFTRQADVVKKPFKMGTEANISGLIFSIFMKLFGKKSGLIGSYKHLIPKLQFLIYLYVNTSMMGEPNNERTRRRIASLIFLDIKDLKLHYDFTSINEFLRALNENEIIPISLIKFSTSIISVGGMSALPMFEDVSRFFSTLLASTIPNSQFSYFWARVNQNLYNKLVEIALRELKRSI